MVLLLVALFVFSRTPSSAPTVADDQSAGDNMAEELSNEGDTLEEANEETTMNDTPADVSATRATLKTSKGDIVIELAQDMPITVGNFVKLASEDFYDGVKFHRVIKGFMIQGGDPLTKDDSKMNLWGTGDPGYKIQDEFTEGNANNTGTISMANAGPNTGGSQFFINVADNNFLDGKHPVFGTVVEGMDVVTAIENTETAPGDRPVEHMVIEDVVLE